MIGEEGVEAGGDVSPRDKASRRAMFRFYARQLLLPPAEAGATLEMLLLKTSPNFDGCSQMCPRAERLQLRHPKPAALRQESQPARAISHTSLSSPALKISESQLQRALLSATRAVKQRQQRSGLANGKACCPTGLC